MHVSYNEWILHLKSNSFHNYLLCGAFAFLFLLDSLGTNVDCINQDDTEDDSKMQGKIVVNLTAENLKKSSSEV